MTTIPTPRKRLIVCCDGTWMNSDNGYVKPGLFQSKGKLQTPSNVTRISRSLRRVCEDGTLQIIAYQNGVGSGSTLADKVTGGALGNGVEDNVREAYAFIAANYNDGDDIILIGFSRGAFTARSVAGMIGDLGLLTRQGMEYFYIIFKDMENWKTPGYSDPFPNKPFPNKPRMPKDPNEPYHPEVAYRAMLIQKGLTRVQQKNGDMIKVKAVGVWDTVGSLGIPNVSWVPNWMKTNWLAQKLSLDPDDEFRFYDTNLSDRIEHAFQALALDEHRFPFAPAVWERTAANRHTTELRQVWFPGNHGNIGGGWADAGIANMSLAWMMDQLASVGVEFDEATITRIFSQLERYYQSIGPKTANSAAAAATTDDDADSVLEPEVKPKKGILWAASHIYEGNAPIRPWGLGALMSAMTAFYRVAGYDIRSPGLYKKPGTKLFLEDTNERIHSSVRVRLAVEGLGLSDEKVWDAPALKGRWQLKRTDKDFIDPIPKSRMTWEHVHSHSSVSNGSNGSNGSKNSSTQKNLIEICAEQQRPLSEGDDNGGRWVWEYCGPKEDAPPTQEQMTLVEEPLGPFERQLLRLSGGRPNIYEYAEALHPTLK